MVSDRYQAQWVNVANPSKVIVIETASVKASGGFLAMLFRLAAMCQTPPSPKWEPQIVDECSPYFVSNTDVKA